jgi:excinuclease ABC subunit A
MQNKIIIRGARQHNLKNLDLDIPRNRLIVITGPSGCGKSSLAIDTIYAEGQRRYVESLSMYARQFLGELQKPDIDYIEGLSPAIAIEQKTVSKSPRSTLGTLTEIYDYMRVLFTRIGKPHCHRCLEPITAQEPEKILDSVMKLKTGTRIQVLSPIVKERKGIYNKELTSMRREGFVRARIDGRLVDLTEDVALNKNKRHTIEVVIDRLVIKPGIERKLREAVNSALKFNNVVVINLMDEDKDLTLSRSMSCPRCGMSVPELTPMFFSFNSRLGACPACKGLGFENLDEQDDDASMELITCKKCAGLRLKDEALSVRVQGLNIGEVSRMSVGAAHEFFKNLELDEREKIIAPRILKEITDRLGFLERVGLEFLGLNRMAVTLSGGEAQRVRLATQIGSALSGVLYILDEPSIGLHPRDCSRLIDTLYGIRDAGNTVIVVEHDEETIRSCDLIIDMGPGAGRIGGRVVAMGTPEEISKNPASLTGRFLREELKIVPPERRRQPKGFLTVAGAAENNLKDITVKIPLGVFLCVTGVSGSGKSTLVLDTLFGALLGRLHGIKIKTGRHESIAGDEALDKVICVDQSPIGKTPRSNPATYTGILTIIRELFSALMESRARGYGSSRFSFNVKGGRCEACKGAGYIKHEMHFLPAAYVPCDQCAGKRYNRETLNIRYKGRTITDVLDMSVSEAREFFIAIPALRDRLTLLDDVGLGYIHLGQPAGTLSGGEAQRLRLSREFTKKATGKTLYILDEPTTGLHFVDIQRLLLIIQRLVDAGNTVVVIEHNLDIVKSADYVIDMGPEGGEGGGRVVAQGTPEEIAQNSASHTGEYLKGKL